MSTDIDLRDLGTVQLFEGLTHIQLEHVNKLLRWATYPAKTNFINVGLPDDAVYIILTGTVKIHVQYPDGKDVILAILKSGDLVGELNVVDHIGRSATAVTREESVLRWLERPAFEKCLETMPLMSTNLVRILGRRLRLANARIQLLSVQDVFGRVAYQLLALTQEYGEVPINGNARISIRLTQGDIAGLVGATRKSVNEAIMYYKEKGYISEEGCFYTIHNQQALALRCK